MKTLPGILICGLLLLFAWAGLSGQVEPLTAAHAHNDYLHDRPLLDALACGFCSVEADVHLVNGELMVAHDRKEVVPDHTLESLYLQPLEQIARTNQGRIYLRVPEITLLVDLKDPWTNSYPVLRKQLGAHSSILTSFGSEGKTRRAVQVILTGNTSVEMFHGEKLRLAGIDGILADLGNGSSPDLMPLVSGEWKKFFKWNGIGPMPELERRELDSLVARAHHEGRRIRFWGAPDNAQFWKFLLDHKVDLVNTDNLKGFRDFVRDRFSPF